MCPVLYSLRCNLWKISDFGTMAEATSKHARPTEGRGTASYRAPELFKEPPRYTRKVDIWAMGCILYELVSGKKAFKGDWHVREYSLNRYDISFESPIPECWQLPTQEYVRDLLQLSWGKRPTASASRQRFESYKDLSLRHEHDWQLLHLLANLYNKEGDHHREAEVRKQVIPLFVKYLENVCCVKEQSFDALSWWSALSHSHPNSIFKNARKLSIKRRFSKRPDDIQGAQQDWSCQEQSAILYDRLEDGDGTIAAWKELVSQNPNDLNLQNGLQKAYLAKGDDQLAVAGWMELVDCHPSKQELQLRLATAYRTQGDKQLAIAGWMELVARHPYVLELQIRLAEAYDETGDDDSAMILWKYLVSKSPSDRRLQTRLASIFCRKDVKDTAILTWTETLKRYPEAIEVASLLDDVLLSNGDRQLSITVWKELTELHPAIGEFQYHLADNYEETGQFDAAIGVWKRLVRENPKEQWQERLANCCRRVGDEGFAREIWADLAETHPTVESLRKKLVIADLRSADLLFADLQLEDQCPSNLHRSAYSTFPESSGNEFPESGQDPEESDEGSGGILWDPLDAFEGHESPTEIADFSPHLSRTGTIKRLGAQIKRKFSWRKRIEDSEVGGRLGSSRH